MGRSKYYVVWSGFRPGVYSTWEECKLNVEGYEQPRYKSFPTAESAQAAFEKGYSHYQKGNTQGSDGEALHIIYDSISVDAACSGNPGEMEYRGVMTSTGQVIFHKGPFKVGTNNIGEFLALVHALALQNQHGTSYPIYTDSMTALSWVRRCAYKTNLPRNADTDLLFDLLDRAVVWLQTHKVSIPILKWNTQAWGEIKADFGRKK